MARFIGLVDALASPSVGRDERDERLVLCGDIFDAWWGFPTVDPLVRPAFDALARARGRGVPIAWVRGNRDFHAGPAIEALGITVTDVWRAEIHGRRVLAVHGDRCDTRLRQRALTRLLRGPAPRALARLIGADRTWTVARRIGATSRANMAANPAASGLLDVQRRWADARLGRDADLVVMGHVHVPLLEPRDGGTFLNLGSLADHGTYGVIDDSGPHLRTVP